MWLVCRLGNTIIVPTTYRKFTFLLSGMITISSSLNQTIVAKADNGSMSGFLKKKSVNEKWQLQ